MIRALHVITGLNVGGAEATLEKLIEHSDRARFEHIVVSLMDLGVIGERLGAHGVEVHALDGPTRLPDLGRRSRFEEIGTADSAGNYSGMDVSRQSCCVAGATICFWSATVDLGHPPVPRSILRRKVAYPRGDSNGCDAFCQWMRWSTNAERSRIQHESVGFSGRPSIVIPNGFDTTKYIPSPSARAEVRRELGLPADAFLIGLIGRFIP